MTATFPDPPSRSASTWSTQACKVVRFARPVSGSSRAWRVSWLVASWRDTRLTNALATVRSNAISCAPVKRWPDARTDHPVGEQFVQRPLRQAAQLPDPVGQRLEHASRCSSVSGRSADSDSMFMTPTGSPSRTMGTDASPRRPGIAAMTSHAVATSGVSASAPVTSVGPSTKVELSTAAFVCTSCVVMHRSMRRTALVNVRLSPQPAAGRR